VTETPARPNPVIALVAGEASGDLLGAALAERLRQQWPQARLVGVAGPGMQSAGVEAWWDIEQLAVMGLFEVVRHFRRLLALRNTLRDRLLELRPDVVVGIDAPDFNLGLEIQLRRAGLQTVHYVSPTVWAWRRRRVHKIARAADTVLCLFPFEPAFYEGHGVAAEYVGHPMADQIPPSTDPAAEKRSARSQLGLPAEPETVALLPGSRLSEVRLLARPMLEAAAQLSRKRPGIRFVAAMANAGAEACFRAALQESGGIEVACFRDRSRSVIGAADVVLCASGTATLETMLVNRPLVMAYRLARSTYLAARYLGIVRRQLFALPNILAGEELVPELIQQEASADRLAAAAERWLGDEAARASLHARFAGLHRELRCDAAGRAAEAVARQLG